MSDEDFPLQIAARQEKIERLEAEKAVMRSQLAAFIDITAPIVSAPELPDTATRHTEADEPLDLFFVFMAILNSAAQKNQDDLLTETSSNLKKKLKAKGCKPNRPREIISQTSARI